MNFDLSKMKKVSHDEKSATFRHPDGHMIKVAMGPLSEKMRQKMKELPTHEDKLAQGGEVKKPPEPKPPVDPDEAKKFSSGFNNALGFAEGGEAQRELASKAPEDFVPGQQYSEAAKTGSTAPITINVGAPEKPAEEKPTTLQDVVDKVKPVVSNAWNKLTTPIPSSPEGSVNELGAVEPPVAPQPVGQPAQPEASQPQAPAEPQAAPPQAAPAPVAQAPQVTRQPAISKPEQIYQDMKAQKSAENQKIESDLANNDITPKTYADLFADKGTLGKIGTIFGLLASGAGSGLSHQPNALLAMMDKQIDRDLEAQSKNQTDKINLLTLSKKQLLDDANIAHINQDTAEGKQKLKMLIENDAKQKALNISFHHVQQAVNAMSEKIPEEVAAKQKKLQALGMTYNAVKEHISSLEDINAGIAAQQALTGGDDPSTLVATKVPQHMQAKVFDEIKAAQNTKKNGQLALDAFDRAVKDTQLYKTGGIRTPGSVSALHEALGPTFQDIEGTVRQAAMDNTFKNVTPNEFDDPKRTAEKRRALIGYLSGKTAAPVAKGFGIDLGRYGSTNWQPTQAKSEKADSSDNHAQAMAWAKANPKDPRSKTILSLAKGR